MKCPIQIPLGGRVVTVDYEPTLTDEKGNSIAAQKEQLEPCIKVNKSAKSNDSERKLFSTLLHELIHDALEVTGHTEWLGEKREEAITYALEAMLAPILTLNPEAKIKYKDIEFPGDL